MEEFFKVFKFVLIYRLPVVIGRQVLFAKIKLRMIGSENFESKTFKSDAGGAYGVKSSLRSGLKSNRGELQPSHPLAALEKTYNVQVKQKNMMSLRNSQGIHAPLKIQMELNAVDKALTRLPCLPSSNLAKDILSGTDDMLLPEDVFGFKEDGEAMGDPHLMMEHKLGLRPL